MDKIIISFKDGAAHRYNGEVFLDVSLREDSWMHIKKNDGGFIHLNKNEIVFVETTPERL